MREIVINGRFLSRRVTGVERHGREILSFFDSKSRVEKTRSNGITGHLWEQFVLPTKLDSDAILWSPANTGPVFVRNQALTIHDLSALEHPEWFQKGFSLWYRLFLPVLVKRVRVVFTPSEYVKRKMSERFNVKNVIITPNGVDTACFHSNAQRRLNNLPERFILFVGSLQPRKNLQALFNAWNEIATEHPDLWLVIVGGAGTVFQKPKLDPSTRVHFLGYVHDDTLPGLYARAELFVLPSFEEGFGLPAIEAMACGTPVLVSDGGALPEVVGEAGCIFELSDPNGLVNAMRDCLNDPELRSTLSEKGLARARTFSWRATADLIWKTLHEI